MRLDDLPQLRRIRFVQTFQDRGPTEREVACRVSFAEMEQLVERGAPLAVIPLDFA